MATTAAAVMSLAPRTFAAPPAPTGQRSDAARSAVVVDLSADEKENAELLLDVRSAVAEHINRKGDYDFTVVDVNGPLNAGGETKDRTNLATAQGFAQVGVASAGKKEWLDAADQLDSARKLYEESLGVADDPRAVYAPLVVKLGEALLMNGDAAGARDAFLQAAFWGAAASTIGAEGKAAFQKAKDEIPTLPKGVIEVNTDPPYAEVFVDGKFEGVSPLRMIDVPAGAHLVTVSKPAYERGTARLDVKEGKTSHKDLTLSEARRKLIYDGIKPKLLKEIEAATTPGSTRWGLGGDATVELGTLFRSEVAVLVKVTGPPDIKSVELWAFHIPSQRLVASSRIDDLDWSFHNSGAVRMFVQKTLDIDWVTKLGGEVEGPPTAEGGITSKWWFWTLIGVVVAGGTTAVVLATQEGDSPPPFSKTPDTGAVVVSF